jgi:hypothetical protein
MALGDYILCCKCEVKLIYDGDRGQREWWEERFGKPPEIECPDCKLPRQPLTVEHAKFVIAMHTTLVNAHYDEHKNTNIIYEKTDSLGLVRAIEAAHGIKEKT